MSLLKSYTCVVGLCLFFAFVTWKYKLLVVQTNNKVRILSFLMPQNNNEVGESEMTDSKSSGSIDSKSSGSIDSKSSGSIGLNMNMEKMKAKNMDNFKFVGNSDTDFYRVPKSQFYLYKESAFVINEGKTVIILGFLDKYKHNYTIFCTFLCDHKQNLTMKGSIQLVTVPKSQQVFKYLSAFYKCPLKDATKLPQKVIISKGQDTLNHRSFDVLNRLNHTVAAKDGIAICVKRMYKMTSPRWFTEWMEMQRIMGANKVIIYGETETGQDVQKLVKYYQSVGLLHVQPWKLGWNSSMAPNQGGSIHTQGQYASNNDCLYRFGYLFRYMVYIDLDEMIVPTNATNERKTYLDIINLYNTINPDVLQFKHCLFCAHGYVQQINKTGLITKNIIYRQEPIYTTHRQKCIIKPSSVSDMSIHVPRYRSKKLRVKNVSPLVAKLHHYRYMKYQKCYIKDTSMSVYVSDLTARVSKVLKLNGIH